MVSARQLIPARFYNGVIPRNGCVASEEKNKTGNLQKTVWRHTLEAPKEGDVMRTSRTKYTTRAGLCAMALVLAAALVLAGCEQGVSTHGEPQGTDWRKFFDENTIKQFQDLKSKPAGTYTIKVTGTIEYYSRLTNFINDLELPANVLIDLDLSGISAKSSTKINSLARCPNLETVILPSIVTTLESGAFSGCINLKKIVGLEQVTSIERSAFSGCTKLETITLNNKLEIINPGTFSGCTSLKEITLPNTVKTIDFRAFEDCTSLTTIKAEGEGTTSGGEGIAQTAFSGCSSLTTVTIPKSIETVDGFYVHHTKAENLTSVTLQEGNKNIAMQAFYGNTKLTKIEIPSTVTSIQAMAFGDCDTLTSVTFKDTTGWKNKKDSQSIDVTNPETNATNLTQFMKEWRLNGIYK